MKDFNYPAQSGAYKVMVKKGGNWRDFDTVRLEISVGQPYHEGEKFAATMDWARGRFKRIVILLNDTLQRHNLEFEGHPSPLLHTRRLGDEWLERNGHLLEGCEVYRWDEWMNKPDFPAVHAQALALYAGNRQFRDSLQSAIDEVWQRRDMPPSRRDAFYSSSLRYLLEETAVFAMAYDAVPGISAYPGSFLEMWSMFVDRETPGAPRGLSKAHCVRIDFARKRGPAITHTVPAAL